MTAPPLILGILFLTNLRPRCLVFIAVDCALENKSHEWIIRHMWDGNSLNFVVWERAGITFNCLVCDGAVWPLR